MEKARLGELEFDITVEDDGPVRRVTVDNLTGPLRIDAVVSVSGELHRVAVNGAVVEPVLESRWGRTRALLPTLDAGVNAPVVIEVVRTVP